MWEILLVSQTLELHGPFYYALLPPNLPSNAGGDVACFGDNEGTGGPHKDQESLRVQEPPLSTAG